ncbi:MAG TPA: BatA and WFA domain-containing protein [Thermodesulfobacteriota bacterium]|nr:BatA and WFA domain-containing protein [Thermodesulfobacteriota bacterium]
MSLSFLNPFFLFGLAAAAIPILIHRLTKRKALTQKFSAVRLLLESQRMVTRPQRLRHLFLLALRIVAMISLVLLMARPVLTEPGLLAQEERAMAIILDNSLSMAYREERGERYDLAKKAVKEVMEKFYGHVVILPTASFQDTSRSRQESQISWMTSEEALKALSSIPLSYGKGDLNACLHLAYQKLKEIKRGKEVLIVSDLARGDWERVALSKLEVVPAEVETTVLRIGKSERDPNLTVKEVKWGEGEAVVGARSRLEVTVSNLSDRPGTTLVQLFLSGIKVDQKSIDIDAMGEGKVYFELSLDKKGWVSGEVRLSGDNLSQDDSFYFPWKVREKIKVLIIDGAPKASLKESESYYLIHALRPGDSEESPFIPRVISEEEVANTDTNLYEVIAWMNAARLQGSQLASILESGKPVLLFLGDQVIPDEYNQIPLFPWRIRERREARIGNPERIAHADDRRDFLKPFSGPGGESLRAASFQRYFRVEGSMRSLLTFGNQDPLLVESEIGKSKILLFTSSGDLDWNDLPLKAAYLPLIQGMIKEAVGLFRDPVPPTIRFGEPFRQKTRPIQLAGPEGGPGIYQFFALSEEVRQGVNPSFEESDLGKLTNEEVRKKFGKEDIRILEYKEGVSGDLQTNRKEIWPFLLAFLLMVLGVEMVVANGVPKGKE